MGTRKIVLPIIFSIILFTGSSQLAFAGVASNGCESKDSGLWSVGSNWLCDDGNGGGDGPPPPGYSVLIHQSHTITLDVDVSNDVTIEPGSTLIVQSGVNFTPTILNNESMMTIENNGNIVTSILENAGTFNNNCGSSLEITDQGTNGNSGIFNNLGIFKLGPSATFENNNFFGNAGTLMGVSEGQNFQGDPIQMIADICIPVGGFGIPIDTTALLLASAQSISLWMIPVIAGIGIGVFIIKKRF